MYLSVMGVRFIYGFFFWGVIDWLVIKNEILELFKMFYLSF